MHFAKGYSGNKNLYMKLFYGLVLVFIQFSAIGQDVVKAADQFLNSLDNPLRKKVMFPLNDPERFNWFFIPIDRQGATFHDFNEEQKKLALTLLKASLSERSYHKAEEIMAHEEILRVLEGRPVGDTRRDPKKYYISIFGKPAKDQIWGWRIEGHHLSLNYLSARGKMESGTPMFWGSNPAIVPEGPQKGKQILQFESDFGFELLHALSPQQLEKVLILQKAPNDIFSGNNKRAEMLLPKGLAYPEMNDQQQAILMKLLKVYVENYPFDFSSRLMNKIKKAGIENLSFAWAGSQTPDAGHYYRIQGPMLLIEFDNVQNDANHIHTVIRDLTNDFGEDILKEHYQKEH